MGENEQAFPMVYDDSEDAPELYCQYGMTLRDYFAAKAMQAMISNPKFVSDKGNFSESNIKAAWEIADTMLKEREKRKIT